MSGGQRRKSLDSIRQLAAGRHLERSLGPWQLAGIGVGAIIGMGIYTLTGIGAGQAGPAVVISFAVAGLVCAAASLAYAEMASLMPVAGSAYTYSYVVLGELAAWIVGWSLFLEYALACSAVAVGWSAYFAGLMQSIGWTIAPEWLKGPGNGGLFNVPAATISLAVALLLALGTRESARLNTLLVAVKLLALGTFVIFALRSFDAGNLVPFAPFGTTGVLTAAALVFFAFFGFDAVSTAAEEARDPGRDMKFGIIGSMLVCTLLYMLVALAAVAALRWDEIAGSAEPLASVLRHTGYATVANLVATAAICATPSVLMSLMFGQTRVSFAMTRDGLLPQRLAAVHPRWRTPHVITLLTGVVVAIVAGGFRLDEIAALANAGTLCAFIAVAVAMLVLRQREPTLPRSFACPAPWLVGPLAIGGCLGLFFYLGQQTLLFFLVWQAIGLAWYFGAGRRGSRLAE
jgi:APA family basic amino acid/polyamine antiporter